MENNTLVNKALSPDLMGQYFELYTNMAKQLINTQIVKENDKEWDIVLLLLASRDLWMSVTEWLNCLAVINKKVTMYGPKIMERVREAGYEFKFIEEDKPGKQEGAVNYTCTCEMWRANDKDNIWSETWDMSKAQKADLLKKENWIKYPKLMLRYRAVGECVKFFCPQVLGWVSIAEEMKDTIDESKVINWDVPAYQPSYIEPMQDDALDWFVNVEPQEPQAELVEWWHVEYEGKPFIVLKIDDPFVIIEDWDTLLTVAIETCKPMHSVTTAE